MHIHAIPFAHSGESRARGARSAAQRRDDLTGNQPVEEHADGGEVLLDARFRERAAELLDISGDVDGLDLIERKLAASHQRENWETATKYARRVLRFLMWR